MKRALFMLLFLPIAACAGTGAAGLQGTAPVATGTPAGRFQTGHALFSARCQSCHALPEPTHLRPEAWPAEVSGMSRKAGLSTEQVALIAVTGVPWATLSATSVASPRNS